MEVKSLLHWPVTLAQWATIGAVVLALVVFFACAYTGRWTIHEIKKLLGVYVDRR